MPYSTCCGAHTTMPEMWICPDCLDHCDWEEEDEDEVTKDIKAENQIETDKLKIMKTNYELRQSILDKWEKDMLIEKIVKLEKRIGELELQLKNVHHNPKYFTLNNDR